MAKLHLFDSDGNVIDGPFDLDDAVDVASIGIAVAHHYRLVASTPGASEPFITLAPEPPYQTICERRGYHMPSHDVRATTEEMAPGSLCIDCDYVRNVR